MRFGSAYVLAVRRVMRAEWSTLYACTHARFIGPATSAASRAVVERRFGASQARYTCARNLLRSSRRWVLARNRGHASTTDMGTHRDMRFAKISYLDVEAAVEGCNESHWSTEHAGQTIDVDLAEVEPDLWTVNVSVRVSGWADDLRFTSREAARAAGEQLGKKFVDELD